MTEETNDLTKKADAAFRLAALDVIKEAKQTGTPVIVWEDGRIKEIPCDELDEIARRITAEMSDSTTATNP